MNNQNPTVGLMYFSPTGTTRKVCEEIANSINEETPTRIDLTTPKIPEAQNLDNVDLWVVGVPVYASRMPSLAQERLNITLNNIPKKTPAIAVAVYGNVDAGIALKQLIDMLSKKGLNVVGAGEFIGQHYFKQFHGLDADGTLGRPNKEDLALARELGISILKKELDSHGVSSFATQSAKVPLKLRFTGEKRVLSLLGPSTVDPTKCTKCQACVNACPVGCIDSQTLTGNVSTKNCLGCGNCLRVCPNKARSQRIKLRWLIKRMAKPKNPTGKSNYII